MHWLSCFDLYETLSACSSWPKTPRLRWPPRWHWPRRVRRDFPTHHRSHKSSVRCSDCGVSRTPANCVDVLPRALSSQRLLSRDAFAPETWGDSDAWLRNATGIAETWRDMWIRDEPGFEHEGAALVVAWYRRGPWSDPELAKKLSRVDPYETFHPNAREMLATLGDAGTRVLEGRDAET